MPPVQFFIFVTAVVSLLGTPCLAQELSPRAFWPAPTGTRIATMGYSYTSGDTLTDPSLPITGVNSDINNAFFTLFQTVGPAGRTTNFIVEVPSLWGESEGSIRDNFAIDRNLDGLGDIAFTASVNLLGETLSRFAPNQEPAQWAVHFLTAMPAPVTESAHGSFWVFGQSSF